MKNVLANNNLLGNLQLSSILDDASLSSILGSTLGGNNVLSGGITGDLPLAGGSPVGSLLESTPIGGLVEDSPVKAVGGALGGDNKLLGGSGLVGGLFGGKNGKRHLAEGTDNLLKMK